MPISGSLGVALLRTIAAMGTVLSIEVRELQPPVIEPDAALRATESAFTAVEQAEKRLSTWRKDTELSDLNRSGAGRSQPLSPGLSRELDRDLRFAEHCRELTDGAFHPGLGSLVEAWKLRTGRPQKPSPEVFQAALEATRDRSRPGFLYEEGGFAKGIALDDAATRLRSQGVRQATLNFGGQVLALADPGVKTEIRISHPSDRTRDVLSLELSGSGSVSTSGYSERGAHILNPSTGELIPGWGSATAIASDAAWADCLSTAFFVMGAERALQWQSRHPEYQFIALKTVNDRIFAQASCGLKGKLRPLKVQKNSVSITFHCNPVKERKPI